jgi:hypothetical protein
MTRRHRMALRYVFAAIVGIAGLLMSERSVLLQDGARVSSAEARIGRPLTPMSYAGVARRTTRRAVGYGAVGYGAVGYGGVGYGAAVAAPLAAGAVVRRRCVQEADPYGRVVRRCY